MRLFNENHEELFLYSYASYGYDGIEEIRTYWSTRKIPSEEIRQIRNEHKMMLQKFHDTSEKLRKRYKKPETYTRKFKESGLSHPGLECDYIEQKLNLTEQHLQFDKDFDRV